MKVLAGSMGYTMDIQTFYGRGSHATLWAVGGPLCKITISAIPNRLNHCVFLQYLYNSNEEVLHRVKEERNIQRGAYSTKKGTWIGHILCKNRLPKHVTEETYQRQEDEEEDVNSYWMT